MILESLILIKCGGILSFILIKCADVVVLVRVSVAAVAAGCGSNGVAWTQGLISTAAQVRGRLGILRSMKDAGSSTLAWKRFFHAPWKYVIPPICSHSARRLCRRPRVETLSALFDETLRLTWRDSPPCLMRLSALHDSKYGGELSEVRRRVV